MSVFRKHDDGPVSTALEAQGLAWLAEAMADGGAHVVPVTSGPGWLEEPRLTTTSVTPAGAEAFGDFLRVGIMRAGISGLAVGPETAGPGMTGLEPSGRFLMTFREAGERTMLPSTTWRMVAARAVTGSSLATKPLAPAAMARSMTGSAMKVVRMRMLRLGISLCRSSVTAMPSMRGIWTSRRSTSTSG